MPGISTDQVLFTDTERRVQYLYVRSTSVCLVCLAPPSNQIDPLMDMQAETQVETGQGARIGGDMDQCPDGWRL